MEQYQNYSTLFHYLLCWIQTNNWLKHGWIKHRLYVRLNDNFYQPKITALIKKTKKSHEKKKKKKFNKAKAYKGKN